MQITDTHSHIYLREFEADRIDMLKRAGQEGVKKILMPAIDSTTHDEMIKTENLNPGQCFSMMGLHPCSVKGGFRTELEIVKNYFSERN